MTPDQVDALDDDVYMAFVRHMEPRGVRDPKATA